MDSYGRTIRAAKFLGFAQQLEDGSTVGDLSTTASEFVNPIDNNPVATAPVEETAARESASVVQVRKGLRNEENK